MSRSGILWGEVHVLDIWGGRLVSLRTIRKGVGWGGLVVKKEEKWRWVLWICTVQVLLRLTVIDNLKIMCIDNFSVHNQDVQTNSL